MGSYDEALRVIPGHGSLPFVRWCCLLLPLKQFQNQLL